MALAGLAASGVVLEVALLWGWLRALSFTSHPGFPANNQDGLPWILGNNAHAINHWLFLLALAFAPYLAAMAFASRARGRVALAIALAGPVLFGATMLLSFPAGAMDVFNNILNGRMLWVHHLNPLTHAPVDVSGDPLYPYVHYWRTFRSSYGPLWFLLTGPATLIAGDSLTRGMLVYKALPLGFELACVALITAIVRRIAPAQAAAAAVCLGWNPLVLWEVAGNGHNDAVMMAFVLLAVLVLLTARWPLAFVALACSALVKFVSLALLPVFVIWALRRWGRAALRPLAGGLALMAVLIALAYLPFWRGMQTLEPLRSQAGLVIFSPAGALLGTWDQIGDVRFVLSVKLALTALFAVLYAIALLRIRGTPASLCRAGTETMFLVLVLLAWWFWPWYVLWGLALAALIPLSAHGRLFILFSMTAMAGYVSFGWGALLWNWSSGYAAAIGTPLIVFLPPVLYASLCFLAPAEVEG
jgi:alpha-1,6-mannosyltransferase